MTMPRSALVSSSQSFTWSDGTEFTGYAIIDCVAPIQASAQYPSLRFANTVPGIRIPYRTQVMIMEGKADQYTGLFYNSDIDPPGSRYVYWLFDSTGKRVSSNSDFFTVSASTVTLPTLTPTVPTESSSVPTAPST